MKIFTVRHGQTSWNPIGRLQGHVDMPLNEAGLAQAERLGTRLAGEKVDIVYSSDLARAAKTAEIINSHHNAEFVASAALRELNFGKFDGRIYDEDVAREIDYYQNARQPLPGGECIFEYADRIRGFLDEITTKHHLNVVIVGHFGTVRAAICYFLQIPVEGRDRFHIDNTAIHCFERGDDGKFHMTLENCTMHLN
jgi:broad specificity phosphatase PhoE